MNIYIILLFISFSEQQIIKNGVYNIMNNNNYLQHCKRKILNCGYLKYPNTFFRIYKINNNSNYSFYYIEDLFTRNKLSYIKNKELKISKKNDKNNLWKFIKLKNNNYKIINKKGCYIKINKLNIICENIKEEEATLFNLFIIFEEVEENEKENMLIEKEPIDVLIKYIDLKDPDLNRNGIHQIDKDYDNEELKYSIRSILKNIPWIRKIFILMPNKKVRYFKDYNIINNKIVYVLDKDILGYDSSNSLAFQYRYWKMKKFGISDNFIVMDDDYFINHKRQKSDFFYVEDGKVVPLIITSKFLKIYRNISEIKLDFYKKRALNSREEQNYDIFLYSRYLTYLFIMDIFHINESLYIPRFTHNAIPVNIKDLEEIYYIISNSKYKETTLNSLYRHIENIQFQTFVLSYTFIKYNKKVKDITYHYIKLNESIKENYNYSLFCLNRGAFNYSDLELYKAKITMEYLFPTPTDYEILDYNLANITFNVVHSMEQTILIYEKQLNKIYYFINLLLLIIFLFILKAIIEFNQYKNSLEF